MNAPAIFSRAVLADSIARHQWHPEPKIYCCGGCDEERPFEEAYCPSCEAHTVGYLAPVTEEEEAEAWADFADYTYDTRRDDELLGGGL